MPLTSAEIDALWTFNDPAASRARFELARAEHPESADEIATQIARTLGLEGRFDEGRAVLAAVVPGSPVVECRWHLESARLTNTGGDPAGSRTDFERALAVASAAGLDFYAVDAAHMLGIVCPGPEGLEWNERAIGMAEASPDPRARGWLGSLLNNTAWSLHELGEHERALALFQMALDFRRERGEPETIRIAEWSVARCMRSLGRLDEALAIQLGLEPDGYVHEEIGEILLAQGDPTTARPHFAEAHRLLSQDAWLAANEPERLQRLHSLAQPETLPGMSGEHTV
jgi:tetratricopeptide (TPR) repeat protein